jgi:putative oxidoreductase
LSSKRNSWFHLSWLEPAAEYGPLFIRVLIGWHLVYGNWDRVATHEGLVEFQDMLIRNHFPFTLFNAYLSGYAQVTCGILYIVGLFTRPAALVMIINFIAALTMVHWYQPYPRKALALMMLCTSIFLLLHGPGRVALDNLILRKKV